MLASIGALLLMVFVVGVGPAIAGGSGYTEDNDTNDGGTANNVSDEGDNAHPSGRDRSTENGGSGNQGNSQSDPDGDTNGGPDKANGSGGTDKADQDGNNGCGNDDDFEDDNNGNCGKEQTKDRSCSKVHGKSHGKAKGHGKKCDIVQSGLTPEVCAANVHMSEHSKVCNKDKKDGDDIDLDNGFETDSDSNEDDDVLGVALKNNALADADSDVVLGSSLLNQAEVTAEEAAGAGSLLPFTGAGIIPILAIGALVMAIGFGLMKMKRADH